MKKRFLTIAVAMTFMAIGLAAYAQEKEIVNSPVTFLPEGSSTTEIEAALDICEAVLPDFRMRINGGPGCVVETMNDGTIMVRPGHQLRKS